MSPSENPASEPSVTPSADTRASRDADTSPRQDSDTDVFPVVDDERSDRRVEPTDGRGERSDRRDEPTDGRGERSDRRSDSPGTLSRLIGAVLIILPLALAALWAVVGPTPEHDDAAAGSGGPLQSALSQNQ